MDEVAALARVSPATVYAVAGGKQGLLHTLVDDWTQAPEVDEAYRAIEASDDCRRGAGHRRLDVSANAVRLG